MKTWDSDGGSTGKDEISERRWFAVKVRPHFEHRIDTALDGKSIETFVPMVTQRRRWSDRIKEVSVPLFDGYVFCHIDPEHRLPVLTVPGVQYFVAFGKALAPIADEEIESIRTLVNSGVPLESRPFLREGQRVRVEEGPLAGAEGVLLRTKGADELVVSIDLLQRSVATTIDRDAVTPLQPMRAA